MESLDEPTRDVCRACPADAEWIGPAGPACDDHAEPDDQAIEDVLGPPRVTGRD